MDYRQGSGSITGHPLGSIETLLDASSSRLGIPRQATVASLYKNGSWRLPPAHSDPQLQLQAHLNTVNLTEEPDYFEWEIKGKISNRYSTGEVYHYLREQHDEVDWANERGVDFLWDTKTQLPYVASRSGQMPN